MILFDTIITFFESFIYSIFLIDTLQLEKNKLFLLVMTGVCFVETNIFNYVFINNYILLVIQTFSVILMCYIFTKKTKVLYFLMAILGIGLILISNVVSLFIISELFSLFGLSVKSIEFYIVAVCLSKILYLILCIIVIKLIKKNTLYLELTKWWSLVVFYLVIILMLILLAESIIFDRYVSQVFQILIFLVIMLFIISILIYNRIRKETKLQIELANKLIKNEYISTNYKKINYLYNRTVEDRHRMMYILIKIKYLVESKKTKELIDVLDQEIMRTNKSQLVISTDNPYFDYRINEQLNLLKKNGFDIKTTFQIKRIDILTDEELLEDIIVCIKFIVSFSNDSKYLNINFKQNGLYLTVRLVTLTEYTGEISKLVLKSEFIKNMVLDINNDECVIKLLILI